MPHLLVFGLGYSSRATIRAAGTRYDRITATVRSADRAAALSATPVEDHAVTVLPFDGSDVPEALAAAIATADDILVSAPPNPSGDPVLAACGARLAAHPPKGIAYLSTVGVYGDHGGGWVD